MSADSTFLIQWLQRPQAPLVLDTEALARALGWSSNRVEGALRSLPLVPPLNGVRLNPWAKATPDMLASQVYRHGYVSGEMALSIHNVLSQMPTLMVVVDGTKAPHGRRWMTPRIAIESWEPIPRWSPKTTDCGWALPVASPAQALLDWVYHRWYRTRHTRDRLASFLDDCDQDIVEMDLQEFASQAGHALVQTLAQTILITWPDGESRFPVTHPAHLE